MQTPTPDAVRVSSRFVETLFLTVLSGGAAWLVTWGTFRERVNGLESRMAAHEEAAKERERKLAHMAESKADKPEVADLRREIVDLRTLIANGFDRLNERMDRTLLPHKNIT